VDISPGLPAFHIVGLPDTAVQEARERVRAAIRNSDYEFPMRRIAASLAPADLRKAGPSYDLQIALALLMNSGQISGTPPLSMFLGELALDCRLRHTNGILPMTAVARDEVFQRVFVPEPNAGEAALVDGIEVIPVRSLAQVVAHIRGEEQILP
jgi:magnesium chelatase family protein